MSRQRTGISVSVAPSRWQVAISSTSKAKPAVRSGSAAARASGPAKNLNPHWVSVAPGHDRAGQPRNTAAPSPPGRAVPVLHHRRVQRAGPDDHGVPGGQQADRDVEGRQVGGHVRVAEPDERGPGGEQPGPHREALARALAAQQPDRHRAGRPVPHHVAGASVLALSTTRMAVRSGSVAAFAHRAREPAGQPAGLVAGRDDDLDSRRESLRPPAAWVTTPGRVSGCRTGTGRRCWLCRWPALASDVTHQDRPPTAITTPTAMAMIKRIMALLLRHEGHVDYRT